MAFATCRYTGHTISSTCTALNGVATSLNRWQMQPDNYMKSTGVRILVLLIDENQLVHMLSCRSTHTQSDLMFDCQVEATHDIEGKLTMHVEWLLPK